VAAAVHYVFLVSWLVAGGESQVSESNGGKVFVIKNWHVVLTLISWLVLAAGGYFTIRAQGEQNTRDIERIKQEHISRDQFKEFHDDVVGRLDRIERKIDNEQRRD
jgi:hypothetical protein